LGDDLHSTALWAASGVRLRAGRVPLHSVAVRAAQISLALVRRGAQGRARDAVLVGRRDRHRRSVPDVPERRQPEQTGARQEVGFHVADEDVRALRVHDDHHVRNGHPVPDAHVTALGRGDGRRVSATATRQPWRRWPRLATVQGFHHSRVRRLRVWHLRGAVLVEVGVDWSAYYGYYILLLGLQDLPLFALEYNCIPLVHVYRLSVE